MGKLLSKCWKSRKRNDSYQIMEDIYPFPYKDTVSTPLAKNDAKFYFIKNEKQIDTNINYLHEKFQLSEEDLAILDRTLTELKALKQKYTAKPPLDILDRIVFPSEQNLDEAGSTFTVSSQKPAALLIEVQDANFLRNELLDKHKLKNPYVVVKIYLSSSKKSYSLDLSSIPLTEVQAFQTLKEINGTKPQWHNLFEYQIEDSDKLSMYSFSLALYYTSGEEESEIQIGDEQIFNMNPLTDQRLQTKSIEFKDRIEKGFLAKLRVRFQLVYDLEDLKAKLSRDVRVRIENVLEIKEKHGGLTMGRDDHESTVNSARLSEAGSLLSKSSAHDNEDNLYFVS